MINLIGEINLTQADLPMGTILNNYGKTARKGRKLAHISIRVKTSIERKNLIDKIKQKINYC